MDLGFFGLMDIIVVLLLIVSIFVGYKVGLINSVLKWVKKLSGLIAGILFAPSLGGFINKHFLNEGKIHDFFYQKVNAKADSILSSSGMDEAIDSLGFPGFVDNFIKAGIENYDKTSIVNDITSRLTYVIGVIIAFFILTIGVYIIYIIALAITSALKNSLPVINKIDKILGAIAYLLLGLVLVFIVLLIVTQVAKIDSLESYRAFIYKDMCIGTDEWRMSKYINDHNFVHTIFNLIFGK